MTARIFSVYAIRHLATGRYYFGQTHRSITDRWKSHKAAARRAAAGPAFIEALREFGPEAFEVIPLLTHLTEKAALEWERTMIERAEARGEKTFNHRCTERDSEEASARLRARYQDPAQLEKARAHLAKVAKDPAAREKRKASARRVWASMTPERRAERGRQMSEGKRRASQPY